MTRIYVAFSPPIAITSSTASPFGNWCAMKRIVAAPFSFLTVWAKRSAEWASRALKKMGSESIHVPRVGAAIHLRKSL